MDVPNTLGTSPEGPLKVLTSGIYRRSSGNFQETNEKIDDLMKKIFFRNNIPCITYLFLFLQKAQIFKSSKQGRPRDVFGTQLQDVLETNNGTF